MNTVTFFELIFHLNKIDKYLILHVSNDFLLIENKLYLFSIK
jgi:hypothetical protein